MPVRNIVFQKHAQKKAYPILYTSDSKTLADKYLQV